MVCKKCGTEFVEGIFCPECGTKNEEMGTSTKIREGNDKSRQKNVSASPKQIRDQKHDASESVPKKTIPKKLFIMLGTAVLAVIAVIIIAVNWEGKVDYIATVKAHTPFAVSQGLPYTYEEVLDKYFDPLEWKVREEGSVHYVDISGSVKGMDSAFALTVKVSSDPDVPNGALMEPISVMLDDRQSSVEEEVAGVLYNLFCAYDEGYEIQELTDGGEATLQGEVSLTEKFIDENTGISFLYPAEWVILDSSSEFRIVEMIDSRNTPDHIASFNINMIFDQDPYGVFTGDETFVREITSEYHTFLGFGDVLLGDIPAKVLKYQTEGLNGDNIVITFWYMIGEDAYQVVCSCTASTVDIYEPVFDAIMSSYRVSSSEAVNSDMNVNVLDVDICFKDIPIEELLNFGAFEVVQQFGSGYYANASGGISYDEIEFYMLDDENVGYIWSFYPECFSINGNTLSVNSEGVIYSDEIIELLGSDYEDESLSSGYYMTYHYPTYTLSFGINKFSEVSDIRIYNLAVGGNGTSAYSSDDIPDLTDFSYNNLQLYGGSYDGNNGTSIWVSVYSSFDEGNILGRVTLNDALGQEVSAAIRDDREGDGIYTLCCSDSIIMYIKFYQDSAGGYCADIQGLDEIYTDSNQVETYIMTEQYIP